MSDWPTQEDLKPENNMTFKRIASVIGCNAGIISDAWVNLGLDALDDPNELKDLRKAVKIYGSAAKHARQVHNLLSNLPETELMRLKVSKDPSVLSFLKECKSVAEELEALYEHRSLVVERNKSVGGKDPRADALAELVATIFHKLGRSITFGQLDDKPTTDFCRAVRDVLVICDNKRKPSTEMEPYTNWRSPAQKAFKHHRSNAN